MPSKTEELPAEAGTKLDPRERIEWAHRRFGSKLMMTTSFGAHSAVTLHLVTQVIPDIPVVLVDTGYLFPETYRFADELSQRLRLNLHCVGPDPSAAWLLARHGRLWEQGPAGMQAYLRLHKVEPLSRAFAKMGVRAWISGVRHVQSGHRSQLKPLELQDGRVKIHPVLDWTDEAMEAYLRDHRLPLHPLVSQGYRSIGDVHSTLPTVEGQDPREGRLLGEKRECGIHLHITAEQAASLKSSGL